MAAQALFGASLAAACKRRPANADLIPTVVRDLVSYLEPHKDLDGLFRVPGNPSAVQKLRSVFDSDANAVIGRQDPHVVAALLKLYFRELPEPLLTYDCYSYFIEASTIKNTEERTKAIGDLVQTLPMENQRVLVYLMRFLHQLSLMSTKNKMPANSLAVVFAPNLLRPRGQSMPQMVADSQQANMVVQTMIEAFPAVFDSIDGHGHGSPADGRGSGRKRFSKGLSLTVSDWDQSPASSPRPDKGHSLLISRLISEAVGELVFHGSVPTMATFGLHKNPPPPTTTTTRPLSAASSPAVSPSSSAAAAVAAASAATDLSSPLAIALRAVAADRAAEGRPEAIEEMTLVQLRAEKSVIKRELRAFDVAFEERTGRAPIKADKEVLRSLYQRYKTVKQRIDDAEANAPPESRSSTPGSIDSFHLGATSAAAAAAAKDRKIPASLESDEKYIALKAEKRQLQIKLHAYQDAHKAAHGEKVRFIHDSPIKAEYLRYKELKAQIALMESQAARQ